MKDLETGREYIDPECLKELIANETKVQEVLAKEECSSSSSETTDEEAEIKSRQEWNEKRPKVIQEMRDAHRTLEPLYARLVAEEDEYRKHCMWVEIGRYAARVREAAE
jgi:hypothetical protein